MFFPANENQTILDAALSNNINLEYSCSNGRCGRCKALLLEGSIEETSFSLEDTLLPGEILTCCSVPKEDLLLKANYSPELSNIKRKTFPSKVDTISYLSQDVIQLILRLPETANFEFLPGQYLDLNWMGNKRSYSIASADASNNRVELHIKKVEKGLFSNFLFNELTPGQLLRFYGPLGTFFIRDSNSPLIFLCTGTGFAPVKSIVERLLTSKVSRKISIYWGGRTLDDLYSDLPKLWAEQYEHVQYVPVLSRDTHYSENSPNTSSQKKYVQDVALREHQNLHEFEVYACGSDQMIKTARQLFIKKGLNPENFYSDAFLQSN